MLVYLGAEGKIDAYNENISREDAENKIIDGSIVWTDHVINDPPQVEGKIIVRYLNNDLSIDYRYKEVPTTTSEEVLLQPEEELISVGLLIEIQDKLNRIIEHLGV